MNRLIVFIITATLLIAITSFSGGKVVMTSQCTTGQCVVFVSSSFFSVVSALLFAIFALLFNQQKYTTDNENTVGVWRRFGAFFVDYAALLQVLVPMLSLPILITEASHTENFQWSFYREFSRDTDRIVLLPAIFVGLICLVLYFYKYSMVERQTIGEYVAGYKIIPIDEDKTPLHIKRVLYSFIGLCIWPVSVILALRNGQKQFWWDNNCNTKAVRVKSN